MEQEDLDKLFRDTFTDVEETPNNNIWNKIETKLDDSDKVITLSKRRNMWIGYISAAVVLFILGISLIFFDNSIVDSEVYTSKVIAYNTPTAPANKPKEINNSTFYQKSTILNEKTGSETGSNANNTKTEAEQNSTYTEKRELNIRIEENHIETRNLNHLELVDTHTPVVQVTEIEDIKPLVDYNEETESMYASTTPLEPKKGSIVTNILNKLTENIEVVDSKNLHFSADEEGSIRLDIINSLVKNRNKKRR